MNYYQRLLIRKSYEKFKTALRSGMQINPYSLGIQWELTPIENNVWNNIRYLGLPLYPQFPIGPYFVDFGDPLRKIAIEVDSIAWHRGREKEDFKRQYEIEKMGWNVYRISSRITYANRDNFIDDEGNFDCEKYQSQCSEGFLKKIYLGMNYAPALYMEIV